MRHLENITSILASYFLQMFNMEVMNMYDLNVEQLSKESFKKFGVFFNPKDCGAPLGDENGPIKFFPDLINSEVKKSNIIGVSTLMIEPREFVVDTTEMHENTDEVFGGFDKDVIFHVGEKKEGMPELEKIKVYFLPAGWWVKINAGVWHHAPFVLDGQASAGIVMLPRETYKNDCIVKSIASQLTIDR